MNLNDLKKVSTFACKTIVPIVGIGTTSPTRNLEIASAGSTGAMVTAGGTGQWAELTLKNSNATANAKVWGLANSGTTNTLQFRTLDDDNSSNPVARMVLDRTGNVGIGTTSPGARLDVRGTAQIGINNATNSAIVLEPSTANQGYIRMTTDSLANYLQSGVDGTVGSGKDLRIGPSFQTTPWMTVQASSGNVGIGTTGPSTKLEVSGTIKVADGGETCSIAANGGMIRYIGSNLQFCNGTAWQTLGVAGSGISSLTGDVTATGPGAAAATIANDAVTFAKMQNIATNKLIGRSTAATGDPEEISLSSNLSLSGGTLDIGTVPVTKGGTGLTTTSNNAFLTTNGSGTPSWTAPGTSTVLVSNASNVLTGVGTATTGALLQMQAGGIPAFTTASFPTTTTANQLLYSSATNVVGGLATVNNAVLTTNGSGVPSWGALSSDVFTQYALLAGRAGGQNLLGGTAASENLTLESTSNATKGYVILQPTGGNVGIGTTSPLSGLHVASAAQVTPGADGVHMGMETGGYAAIELAATTGSFIDFTTPGSDLKGRILYNNSSNFMQFATNGAERLRIDTSGNVGIGTASPSAKLDVNGSIKATSFIGPLASDSINVTGAGGGAVASIRIEDPNTGAGGFPQLLLRDRAPVSADNQLWSVRSGDSGNFGIGTVNNAETVYTETLSLTRAGNVGIGTTNPGAKLQVVGNAIFELSGADQLITRNGESYVYLGANTSSDTVGYGEIGAWDNIGTTGSRPLVLQRISGNVGIGTTTPATKLDVNGSATVGNRLYMDRDGSNFSWIQAKGSDGDGPQGAIGIASNATGTVNELRFRTNDNNQMNITSAGRVGIGTMTPGRALEVANATSAAAVNINAATAAQGTLYFQSSGTDRAAIYRPAASNDLRIWTDSPGDIMTFKNGTGNVGIGTTTPATALEVAGAVTLSRNADKMIRFNRTGGNVLSFEQSSAALSLYNENTATPLMTVLNGGNVGIGTTSPPYKLTVAGGTTAGFFTTTDYVSGVTGSGITITPGANTGNTWSGIKAYATGGTVAGDLVLQAGGGNVGVGTTTPGGKVEVSGDANASWVNSAIWMTNTGAGARSYSMGPRNDGNFHFGDNTAGAIRMTVNSSGNIGIGTTDPLSKLSVSADNVSGYQFGIYGTTDPNKQILMGYNTTSNYGVIQPLINGSSWSNLILNPSGGNVGIGTTAPTFRLDVRSTSAVYGESTANYGVYGRTTSASFGGTVGYAQNNSTYGILGHANQYAIYGNGDGYVSGTMTSGSDERLKKDIKSIDNGLDMVLKLKPVSFNWRPDSDQGKIQKGTKHGFIAQEIQKLLPDAVKETSSPMMPGQKEKSLNQKLGKFLTVEYNEFIAYLAKAIQEFYAKFKVFENQTNSRLEALEKQNQLLQQQIEMMKKQNEQIQTQFMQLKSKSDKKPASASSENH